MVDEPSLRACLVGNWAIPGARVEAHEGGMGSATWVRFRWAVQADYFARRITEHDLTGSTGPADNEKGLNDAYAALMTISTGRRSADSVGGEA